MEDRFLPFIVLTENNNLSHAFSRTLKPLFRLTMNPCSLFSCSSPETFCLWILLVQTIASQKKCHTVINLSFFIESTVLWSGVVQKTVLNLSCFLCTFVGRVTIFTARGYENSATICDGILFIVLMALGWGAWEREKEKQFSLEP